MTTVGWTAPYGIDVPEMRSVEDLKRGEPSMGKIIRIGMDTSKSVFVLHGVDAAEQPVLRKKLRRRQVLEFFAELEPTKVGLEACGGARAGRRCASCR
jgi:transposase